MTFSELGLSLLEVQYARISYMSEYEIWDLINGIMSNMFAEQTLFVTMISAYLLVAYSVGKSLTTCQIFL